LSIRLTAKQLAQKTRTQLVRNHEALFTQPPFVIVDAVFVDHGVGAGVLLVSNATGAAQTPSSSIAHVHAVVGVRVSSAIGGIRAHLIIGVVVIITECGNTSLSRGCIW
jgi:hypothetical protein